jgi:hypothetical protein
MDLKSIATTLAFLGTGALAMTGCDNDKPATETPAAPTADDAAGAAEGSCGGDKAEGSCGGDKAEGEGSCGGDKAEGEGSCGGDKAEGEGSCGGAK